MQFTKIKQTKDGKVHLEYQKQNQFDDGKYDEFTIRCADKPLPEFEQALQGLAKYVIEICEFVDDVAPYRILGVSFSWADGIMGATITAQKALEYSNSLLILNTPHKPEEPYSEGGDDSVCLSDDCINQLRELIDQAGKYIDGKRAQMKLFEDAA